MDGAVTTASALFRRYWHALALLLCGAVGVLFGVTGGASSIEDRVRELNWKLRQHNASGALHIIEIDAKSIAAIDQWPWPRSNYTQVIDRLRAAGVSTIGFDVDFSAKSSPAEDQAFAASLARAPGQVVLATFKQPADSKGKQWLDSLPLSQFSDNAMLAAVNIRPDSDGSVRSAPLGVVTGGVPRPSLSAMVAGSKGAADDEFPIDFAIDPKSIPRHSFVDIAEGRFEPADLKGKSILIGATAVELGDRYAVPNHGVVPGVVIQALAAETLMQSTPMIGSWIVALAFSLALCWFLVRNTPRFWLEAALAGGVALFFVSLLADGYLHVILPIVPAIGALVTAAIIACAVRWSRAAARQRVTDESTGLPNRAALAAHLRSQRGRMLATARIVEFDKLVAGLGQEQLAELIKRICDRIGLLSENTEIFRVEDRLLAWVCYEGADFDEMGRALRALMLNPVEVKGRQINVSLALGLASAKQAGQIGDLIAHSALAADRALSTGRDYAVHDVQALQDADLEISLLGELDHAIESGAIHVVYQPKMDLKTSRVTSVEALVRWMHPERGLLRPDIFIPLAERSNRIAKLTKYVVERAIDDLQDWWLAGHHISVAINISAKLLSSNEFMTNLRELLTVSGVDAKSLIFEITESATVSDSAAAARALQTFKDLGVSISIDDYGTGQSTLTYLKQLPLDELKIDRSFVQFAHQNRADAVLVRSTIELAHELSLKVVAEGVEDAGCLTFLESIGCDMAQGYLISLPLDPEKLLAYLGQDSRAAA